ncbi:hypothetical protein SEA_CALLINALLBARBZ_35 [Arthrobacter phage CallinAllBarbz]|uniref:Uncharacterized protein n=1 Tax=Arthrobacter phage CallinAllBarbz TaxID=3077790 RepID=A0AA96K9Y6_9CAUD|nr:hypothetical protein SEA_CALLINALLBARBZ_35 [Arthrobacter phage CallinAllBarbz]
MSARDARGVEIQTGDVVVYTTGGRNWRRVIGRVVDIKTKVRVAEIDFLSKARYSWDNSAYWAASTSCVVVKLPYVEGRLNTEEAP